MIEKKKILEKKVWYKYHKHFTIDSFFSFSGYYYLAEAGIDVTHL